jgi:serine/threonine protein kinase
VFLAEQRSLGRRVALKLAGGSWFGSQAALDAERRALSACQHPHIARLLQAGQIDYSHYLALEFVPGESLQARLDRDREHDARVPIADLLRWGRQVAEALQHLHEHGFLHGDLKPANLRIRPDGQAVLIDFGAARALSGTPLGGVPPSSTLPSAPPAPTPVSLRYAAPELLDSRFGVVDQRADLHSLGLTLYEVACGQPLHQATTAAEAAAAIVADRSAPLTLAADLPRDLQLVLRHACAPHPAHR